MLTFRKTFTLFFLAIGLGNFLHFVIGIHVPSIYYWIVIVVTIAAVVYGSAWVCSGFHFKVICRSIDQNSDKIALSFDDGIHSENTPAILDLLKKHNIRAVFFVVGNTLTDNKSIFNRIVDEGHIVGNHTFSHAHWFDMYGSKKMYEEIHKTDLLIHEFSGKKPRFFRPPYGVTNPMLKKALLRTGHLPVGWSIRSFDTRKNKNVNWIVDRVCTRIKGGDIILFHDTSKELILILEQVLKFGTENGFQFCRLDELIHEKPYDN